ncbi:MAG: LPS export ABC transporter periplasmic protein LptC [Flavobacteriales bacterium]|nr:LPS export ABC transporter periplasmic protein LptC [Flavobacteriales bacterium]
MGLLLVCALWACTNDLDKVAAVDLTPSGPDRVTRNAEYLYSDSGFVKNRLRAGLVNEFAGKDARRTEIDSGLVLTFFDRQGREGSELKARRGRILTEQKRMEVEGAVVFTNARGERLETERLVWSQDSHRVHTDRPVRITRAQDILFGQGLDATEDFSRYTIRRITGSLQLDRDTLAP